MASTSLITEVTKGRGKPKDANLPTRISRAIELKVAGWTYAAIAKELHVSRQRVQQMVRPPKAVAAAVRLRANRKCERCGTATIVGHIHHVQAQDDYNAIENLLYLCNPCHRREHGGANDLFTDLPVSERHAAAVNFIQPYLAHIAKRYCYACGAEDAPQGLCKSCRRTYRRGNRIKATLAHWKRGSSKTANHSLSQAIHHIRRWGIRPEDLASPIQQSVGIAAKAR